MADRPITAKTAQSQSDAAVVMSMLATSCKERGRVRRIRRDRRGKGRRGGTHRVEGEDIVALGEDGVHVGRRACSRTAKRAKRKSEKRGSKRSETTGRRAGAPPPSVMRPLVARLGVGCKAKIAPSEPNAARNGTAPAPSMMSGGRAARRVETGEEAGGDGDTSSRPNSTRQPNPARSLACIAASEAAERA